jgi:hypothetical protein
MSHYKIDLLTDEELSAFTTKEGDILELDVPGRGKGSEKVLAIEITDAGAHPETRQHLNRVVLTLEESGT